MGRLTLPTSSNIQDMRLNNKHTIFGECHSPAVVEAIATTPVVEGTTRPKEDVVLKRVTIQRGS